jgi:hypothetical protein
MSKKHVVIFCLAGLLLTAASAAKAQTSQQCQAAMAAWQQAVANFNAQCSQAQAGSAQAAQCAAQRAQINASRPNC